MSTTRGQVPTLLLERLAYWLIRNGHSEMERVDAIDLIAQVLPTMRRDAAWGSVEVVYRHLLDRSGLLREPADGVVDFVHRTFQDYLAARAAVENRDFPLLVRNAHLDQWEDVVRMAVAHGRPDERKRLLRQLIKRGDSVRKHRVRLHLLAMACLEHAPQLDPGVRREVEQRATALIPPRTDGEARALAVVGQVALELLPGPEGLDEVEAWAVVRTATELGTDAALPKLAEFRTHPSYPVRSTVLDRWSAFDPERFGAEILAGLSLDGEPRLRVDTQTELTALHRLPDYPYLSLFGEFPQEEIVEALGTNPLRALALASARLTDLRFLGRYRSIENLSLINGPAITDLSPLLDLPLRKLLLRKMTGLRDFRCLDALPNLCYLYLGDGVPCPDLEALPTRAPLTDLGLPSTNTDLTGIGVWRGLKTLRITDLDDAPSPESLAAIAELPALTDLVVAPPFLRALRECRLVLPGVGYLHLFQIKEEQVLQDIPAVLPNVRDLILAGKHIAMDPSPLSELTELRSVQPQGVHFTYVNDRLTQVIVSQPTESRY